MCDCVKKECSGEKTGFGGEELGKMLFIDSYAKLTKS